MYRLLHPAPPLSRCSRGPPSRASSRHGSLVSETLEALSKDEAAQEGLRRLRAEGQSALTREEAARRRRALSAVPEASFDAMLASRGCTPLRHGKFETLQVSDDGSAEAAAPPHPGVGRAPRLSRPRAR